MLPEVGGVELLAIAALALIVIGPKDLPVVLRKLGKFVGKMRGMAQEFRNSFDELARQSELDELRKEVEAMRLAQTYDPTGLVPGAYGPQSGYDASSLTPSEPTYLAEAAAEPAPAPSKTPKRTRTGTTKARAAKPATSPAKAKASAAKAKPSAPAKPRKAAAKPKAKATRIVS